MTVQANLGVVGNISNDRSYYSNGSNMSAIGGAALTISLASARAGFPVSPISVIGADLSWLTKHTDLPLVDWQSVSVRSGPSCQFNMVYTENLDLKDISCAYGVASELTEHAIGNLHRYTHYHICCRRPLNVGVVLSKLVEAETSFSLDFYSSSARHLLDDCGEYLSRARTIFTNATEFSMLERVTSISALGKVIVTNGEREVRLFDRGILVSACLPPKITVVNVTGAGDTFTGTFLASQFQGFSDLQSFERATFTASKWVEGHYQQISKGG